MLYQNAFILIILIDLCGVTDILCLKLLKIVVPPYKLRGDEAVMECHYELEGESLYAVKWYKENEEFFRYVPKSTPPMFSYKIDGVKVDQINSGSQHVTLKAVTLKSSGLYRCEVSAEAPSFSSVQNEARMEVIYKFEWPNIAQSFDRTLWNPICFAVGSTSRTTYCVSDPILSTTKFLFRYNYDQNKRTFKGDFLRCRCHIKHYNKIDIFALHPYTKNKYFYFERFKGGQWILHLTRIASISV